MGAVLFLGAGWSQKRLPDIPDIPGIRTGPGQLGTGMGAHCLVAGIANHGSGSPSRGQLATNGGTRLSHSVTGAWPNQFGGGD